MLASFAVLLLDSHLKALAVLLSGSLLSRVAARGSAAHGHRIRAAAFALALAAPVIALTPLAGALVSLRVPEPSPRMPAPAGAAARPESLHLTPAPAPQVATPAAEWASPGSGNETAAVAQPPAARPAPPLPGWAFLLLGPVWLGVAGLLAARLAALHGWLGLRVARTRPVGSPAVLALAGRIAREYALRRAPGLRTGTVARTPFLWGLLRPVIVLPPESTGWDAATWEIVLRHEFAHAARHDSLWQSIAQVVCVWNWFNPLVWRMAARLRREGERACDERVLASGVRASSYAGLLVRFAGGSAPPAPVLAMAGAPDLPGRIDAILRPPPDTPHHGEISMKRHALILSALLAALVMVDVRLAADDQATKAATGTKPPAEVVLADTPVRHLGEAWNAVAWAAHNNELWEGSALGFMNASRQDFDTAKAAYNAACAWSRQGKADEAFEWLRIAREAGWNDASLAREDADLANIRNDPRFEQEMARWESAGSKSLHQGAHQLLVKGLKAMDKHLSPGSPGDGATLAERDASEARLRAAERAEWEAFIAEVTPFERQLPDDGEIQFRLGYALLLAGRAEEALPRFEASLKAGAEEQKSRYNIACCLATIGRTDEAVAALEELYGKTGERHWQYPVPVEEMRVDYDLRALREDARFKALMKSIESGGGPRANPMIRKVWSNLQQVPAALATPIHEG